MKNYFLIFLTSLLLMIFGLSAHAESNKDLTHLLEAYPGLFTLSVDEKSLIWCDGSTMAVGSTLDKRTLQEKIENPTLLDAIKGVHYPAGKIDLAAYFLKNEDPGRIRYEPFSRHMYGNSEEEVRSHLKTIDWMPETFKKADGSPLYQLSVTTVNQVNVKLQRISAELDTLVRQHPDYKKYLSDPGGTFAWRHIANTNRLSYHSFGMTIDINVGHSNYWQWNVYSLYIKPSENAIEPENINGKAVIFVKNQAYFVENHTLVLKNNLPFVVDITLSDNQQKQLAQWSVTDGEIKRNVTNNALVNGIMQQTLANGNRPIPEDTVFAYYPNEIPWPIILTFEKYGFIWGGKWHHFDTMHFEYRPELFSHVENGL